MASVVVTILAMAVLAWGSSLGANPVVSLCEASSAEKQRVLALLVTVGGWAAPDEMDLADAFRAIPASVEGLDQLRTYLRTVRAASPGANRERWDEAVTTADFQYHAVVEGRSDLPVVAGARTVGDVLADPRLSWVEDMVAADCRTVAGGGR